MPLVTLRDGTRVSVYNTDTYKTSMIDLKSHSMRFHVVEKSGPFYVANEPFHTTDRDLQDRLLTESIGRHGLVDSRNTWVKSKVTRKELWADTSDYRRMLLKDLRRYFGSLATVGPTQVRYIYYMSDGNIEQTPDAIGKKFGKPLVYEGYAIASIFDVAGKNVLSPDENIVFWLTRKQWMGFHDKFRGVHKDFPYPTGFVCSKWCQRIGHEGYGNHIWIASMSQGQTVGSWAAISLRQYWSEHQGYDIFSTILGRTHSKVGRYLNVGADREFAQLQIGAQNHEYGYIGSVCPYCGKPLIGSYGTCHRCYSNAAGARHWARGTYCKNCGRHEARCNCDPPLVTIIKMSSADHVANYERMEAMK